MVKLEKKRKSWKLLNKQIFDPLVESLDSLIALIKTYPPLDEPQRFGNKAFKSWYEAVKENLDVYLKPFSFGDDDLLTELKEYFLASFGSEVRIDYGTGHELNFLCILYILSKQEKIPEDSKAALVHQVFYKYVDLMRELQLVYKLEPAGSHGVWGLDDYHFLPFIFGAGELSDHETSMPEDVLNEKKIEENKEDFMYFYCIDFIKKVKSGNFWEHSPMLYDITAAKSWGKVAKGLILMYVDEVFKKFPVMQHFFIGPTIKLE